MSSKSRIDHVAILVDDLKLAEGWYMKRINGSVHLSRPKVHSEYKLVILIYALIDKKHYPNAHTAVLMENLEDLPLEKGEIVRHRDGTIGVYEEDPFGELFRVYMVFRQAKRGIFG